MTTSLEEQKMNTIISVLAVAVGLALLVIAIDIIRNGYVSVWIRPNLSQDEDLASAEESADGYDFGGGFDGLDIFF